MTIKQAMDKNETPVTVGDVVAFNLGEDSYGRVMDIIPGRFYPILLLEVARAFTSGPMKGCNSAEMFATDCEFAGTYWIGNEGGESS